MYTAATSGTNTKESKNVHLSFMYIFSVINYIVEIYSNKYLTIYFNKHILLSELSISTYAIIANILPTYLFIVVKTKFFVILTKSIRLIQTIKV